MAPKTKKPSVTLGDLNDVTLGSSAVFESQNPNEMPEKSGSRGQKELLRPVAFRPHLSMGLALARKRMIGSPPLRPKPQGGNLSAF